MSTVPVVEPIDRLTTDRFELDRHWTASDRRAFAALNADDEVNRFLPGPIDRAASDAMVDRIEAHFDAKGYGLWAVRDRGSGSFHGFVGLAVPRFEAFFLPGVEIGWRLARSSWGRGIATEAARRVLDDAVDRCGLDEIVSFTTVDNAASRRVMERIGMHELATFDHPALDEGDPLRPHVVYRIAADDVLAARSP